jgi:hypothetical protein
MPSDSDNGCFCAEVAQEKLIEASGIPYNMIRSTQFMEFLGGIAAEGKDGNTVRLSPGLFQPIAADDVAPIVTDVALAAPMWRSRRRETASSRSPARNARRSTKSPTCRCPGRPLSVWETTRHPWVTFDHPMDRFADQLMRPATPATGVMRMP